MIKIVFLDFDNTLYNHKKKEIPPSAIKALSEIQAKGVKAYIATGRSMHELEDFDLSKFHYDGIISFNGQTISDKDNQIIYSNPISGVLKTKLVELFNKKTVPLAIVTQKETYINFVNDNVIEIQKSISSKAPKVSKMKDEDFFMASAYLSSKEMMNEIEKIKGYATVSYWTDKAVDIVTKDISKATGINKVLELYGIKKEESMSFGDGENDIEMLEATGISVAMGNAFDIVKEKADYVTDDVDNDGVAKAINKFILNN